MACLPLRLLLSHVSCVSQLWQVGTEVLSPIGVEHADIVSLSIHSDMNTGACAVMMHHSSTSNVGNLETVARYLAYLEVAHHCGEHMQHLRRVA
jgi:hypothetical protein